MSARRLASFAMVSALYLALIYLLAFATKLIASGFIHPVAVSEWSLRYALTIGTLEFVAAGAAALATAFVATALDGDLPWSLPICGLLSAVMILFLPHTLTAAASTATIVWSMLVHAVAPALIGQVFDGRTISGRARLSGTMSR